MNIHLYIFKRYVILNTTLALFMPPILTCIILSKYLKIYASSILKDIGQAIEDSHTVSRLIIKLGACYLLYAFFNEIYDFIAASPIQRAARHASNDFLRNCLMERVRLYECSSGEVGRTLVRSASAVSDLIDITLLEILPLLITFVLALTEMYRKFGYAAFMYNVMMLIVYIVITFAITRYRMRYRRRNNMYENRAHSKCLECIRNVDTITVYKTVQFELNQYDDINKKVQFYSSRQYQSLALLNLTQKVILYIFMVTYLYRVRESLGNDQLLQYFSICSTIIEELSNLGCIYHRFSKAIVDLNTPFVRDMAETNQTYDRKPSVNLTEEPRTKRNTHVGNAVDQYHARGHEETNNDGRNSNNYAQKGKNICREENINTDQESKNDIQENGRAIPFINTKPLLQFQNVTIKHKNTPILTNLTFNVAQYAKVAIVGPNGAGKSSIIKAILKLTPYSGQIQKIENTRLTYTSQEPQLFADTVLYNVAYGSKAKLRCIIAIAMKMGVHKDILRMRGYGSLLTENARNLSGGERQKITLLRNVVYGICACGDGVDCAHCEGCRDGSVQEWSDEEERNVKISVADRESITQFNDDHQAFNSDFVPYEVTMQDDTYQNATEDRGSTTNYNMMYDVDEISSKNEETFYPSAKNSPSILMLFDEATSAMDKSSEYDVIERLFDVCSECTVLMVIHNLTILHLFDTIIYVDKELEIGSFDRLMQKKGNFYLFYERMRKERRD
ncbi:Mitochondrial Fe/S cluster exporter, ABC superfamily [Trachipleistophora hominis]|uniref:Mitochondrial Fe/S cluster exporter, ABC superfamily n=1 Tax=Trachipleistophora hominis TaxID=72359 RepID=L7JVE2_TRAHO|nr:Mitochondrial Fe/S cluster exporter, ABC superfamily [Trachipleistophora hominis]